MTPFLQGWWTACAFWCAGWTGYYAAGERWGSALLMAFCTWINAHLLRRSWTENNEH